VIPENIMKKVIKKEDFTQMEILGQFNLGFILTKINTHLFIIDQHATDEKYRYEMLQKSTSIKQQPLFVPMKLDTTASNEVTIMGNLVCLCVCMCVCVCRFACHKKKALFLFLLYDCLFFPHG